MNVISHGLDFRLQESILFCCRINKSLPLLLQLDLLLKEIVRILLGLFDDRLAIKFYSGKFPDKSEHTFFLAPICFCTSLIFVFI